VSIKGLAVSPDGSLYAAAAVAFGGEVLKIDLALKTARPVTSSGVGSPQGIVVDQRSGTVYVASATDAAAVTVVGGSVVGLMPVNAIHDIAVAY
jgi:DNA-binding beta-propeller fold protein YncE